MVSFPVCFKENSLCVSSAVQLHIESYTEPYHLYQCTLYLKYGLFFKSKQINKAYSLTITEQLYPCQS